MGTPGVGSSRNRRATPATRHPFHVHGRKSIFLRLRVFGERPSRTRRGSFAAFFLRVFSAKTGACARREFRESCEHVFVPPPTCGSARLPPTGWSLASPRQKRELLGLLFDKLWVRRVPDTKWEAEHGQQVNVIASYVPRADYPMEVTALVGMAIGTWGFAKVQIPAIPTPGRRALVSSGKGGLPSPRETPLLHGLLHGCYMAVKRHRAQPTD